MAETAAPRRVLLLDLPRLLADLVRDVVAQDASLEVIEDATGGRSPERAVAEAQAQVVIVGDEDADLPAPLHAAFARQPQLVVLALAGNGRRAALWELVPRRTALGELSADTLRAALRDQRAWQWDA